MIGLLGMSALLHACMQEDVPETPDSSIDGKGLTISLSTSSIHTKVTEDGEDALRENTIEKASVFIFENDGTRSANESYKELELTGGTATLAAGDWKDNRDMFPGGPDAQYDIYVVANYHGTEDLSKITTVEGLKAVMDTDTDIWKPEQGNLGGNIYTGKLFTMTGSTAGFQPSAQENNATVNVDVTRVAVKVRVNIKLAGEFGNVFTPTGFFSLVRNHATKGLLWPDNEGQTVSAERGLAGNDPDEPMVAATSSDNTQKIATLILYTYPNRWGGDALDETFVLLNMPGNYTDGSQTDNLASNYYKIPIRLGTSADNMVLNRNTIYQTTVTIDRLGQKEIDNPVTVSPKFEVVAWADETITIGDEDIQYLELLKDTIIMKNISETAEQYFTSSSVVASDSVEVVDVYYYDKYGAKQTIYNPDNPYHDDSRILSQYGITARLVNDNGINRYGYLNVTSDVPTNNGIRYIWVQVTNAQNVSAKFLVKQYPLEYIVAVPGWYSYRTDFLYNNTVVTYESGPYESPQDDRAEAPQTSNDTFNAKVYRDNSIYEYEYDREKRYVGIWPSGHWEYGDWTVETHSRQDSNPNNNMYFVRITRTSSEYTLATPALDENGYTDSSNENNQLVSPAFMIASQLGTVSIQSFSSAQTHCREYAEKSIAGEVYEDWRLPTEKELWIIDKYQGIDGSVIDRVLAGEEYWAASGNVLLTNEREAWWSGDVIEWNEGTISTGYSDAYIRCIRDVKADEPIMKEN